MMSRSLMILLRLSLETVEGHLNWRCRHDEFFARHGSQAMCIHLVRCCYGKDHRVDTHHSVSSYGGLKVNVVSIQA